jgi:hypothetical protein
MYLPVKDEEDLELLRSVEAESLQVVMLINIYTSRQVLRPCSLWLRFWCHAW